MNMKKIGVLLVLILFLSAISFALANNETLNESNETNETSNEPTDAEQQQDLSKIEEGFECLEEKIENKCDDLTTQELAISLLATPKQEIYDECLEELKDREKNDNFGSVKETALAILALEHSGEETNDYEEWLLDNEITPKDLTWYIQEDSEGETACNIQYDEKSYEIEINENKKIKDDAGACLETAQSNFWLEVDPDCYEETFKFSCDKKFITSLIYQNKNSRKIYVLDNTQSEPAFGETEIKINSKCFSESSSCDYEGTLWATLALEQTGYETESYIPYIIALSETNKQYLPKSFIYLLTNYEDYAAKLFQEQKDNHWEAESSKYGKYYDTSLAVLALSNSGSISTARDWLLFSQDAKGCWNNKVLDTAMVLWALEERSGRSSSGSGVVKCAESGFFCISSSECPQEEKLENYFCSGIGTVCCETENLKSCDAYGGQVCPINEVCIGNERKALETNECCVGECSLKPQETECEEFGYACRDACSDNQEEIDFSCGTDGVCCKTKTSEESSSLWVWILIFGILIVLGILAWIFREKIKLWWFKLKTKFKKDKSSGQNTNRPSGPRPPFSGMPPRPGFPPVRRPSQRPNFKRPLPKQKNDDQENIFKKLKEMSD